MRILNKILFWLLRKTNKRFSEQVIIIENPNQIEEIRNIMLVFSEMYGSEVYYDKKPNSIPSPIELVDIYIKEIDSQFETVTKKNNAGHTK